MWSSSMLLLLGAGERHQVPIATHELLEHVGQGRNARGHRADVVVERAGMLESAFEGGVETRHDVGAAAERAAGEPATQVLSEGCQVRHQVEVGLHAAGATARCLYLIEDQQA